MPAISLSEPFQKPTTMLYRNLLAMETEELLRSYPVDGCVLMGGCDKTTPGLIMGAISMNLPAIFMPAGPMLRGNWRGQDAGQRQRCLEVLGRAARGQHRRAGLAGDRGRHRALGGHLHDHGHGFHHDQRGRDARLALPGSSTIPAVDANHSRMAEACGRRIVEMVWEDLKPRDILTPGFLRQRHRGAHGAGRLDQRDRAPDRHGRSRRHPPGSRALRRDRQRVPLLANMRPSGKYLMEDFYYAGGLRALLAELQGSARPGAAHRQRQDAGREHRRMRRSTTPT